MAPPKKPLPPVIAEGQSFSVDENSGVFTTPSIVVASDPNPGDILTYSIVGGNEAGIFAIDPATGELSVTDPSLLDFESGVTSYSLTIQVTDDSKKNFSATGTITIDVNDVNEAPASLALDNQSVPENAAGAVVGNLAVVDPDAGDSHSFAVSDARFEVVAGQLKLQEGVSLDFEAEPSVTVSVTATDSGGLALTQSFTLTVTDVNEGPDGIALDSTTVVENTAGAVVGNLTVSDPDAGDSHSFTVSDARFEVVDGQLKLKEGVSLDFEAEPSVAVSITVTDSGGLAVTRSFTLAVTDLNEAPTNIVLESTTAPENTAGAVVGTLSVSDPDAADSHTFAVSDSRFEVVAGQLKLKDDIGLDFESEPSVAIQVTATDSGGLSVSRSFTLAITDVAEVPPSDIALDNLTVTENQLGAVVGTLTVRDPDVGETHTFTVSDSRFEVAGGQLKLKAGITVDFEAEPSISLQVTATDSGGLSLTESFVLAVGDANDRPVANPTVATTNEDAGIFSIDLLDGIITSDEDVGDVLSITSVSQIIGSEGRDLGGAFDVTNGVLSFDCNLFSDLVNGESETIVFRYVVDDGSGGFDSSSNNTVTVTVEGRDNMPQGGPLPASISVGELDGSEGIIRFGGEAMLDDSGQSVSSAGDVNGDGFDDFLIGAYAADPDGVTDAGAAYVVFGGDAGWPANVALSSLDGSNGFRLDGPNAYSGFGFAVSSAGDINGDGFDDITVSTYSGYNPNYGGISISYVVFGKAGGWGASLDVATLDGSNGFRIDGAAVGDLAGASISGAGDVNGDGFDDLIVGAPDADPGGVINAGSSYVIFGKADGAWTATLSLATLDSTDGFRLDGEADNRSAGGRVSTAGDVNGDGFDDLIIGTSNNAAPAPTPYGYNQPAGAAYVVFGDANIGISTVDLASLDGSNGFKLVGGSSGLFTTHLAVASAGDVNGDGFEDLVIGDFRADTGGKTGNGASYVVFGAAGGWTPTIDLAALDGTNGFRLDGVSSYDLSGYSVSSAGDFNGDGFDDVIVGSFASNSGIYSGSAYIVFGKAGGWDPSLDLSTLDGTNGFRIDGATYVDRLSVSVSSAGDVNGDGFDDLLLGADGADGSYGLNSGATYLVYGGDFTTSVTQLGTAGADTLTGGTAAESLVGAQGDDTLIGGGGADVLKGGAGDDLLVVSDLGFDLVDGDSGNDTLSLSGAGLHLDLTALPSSVITGIEAIDLTGSGDNSLTLDINDLLQLSDSSNELFVQGDIGDQANLSGAWVSGGTTIVGGVTYDVFTVDGVNATLNLESDITALLF